MCQDAGVVLAYLPPYSPDLNPIEESFAQLKQWIKKNRILAEQFGDDFSGFLRCGLEAIQLACKGHSAVQNLAMMTIWMVIWMKSWMSMNIINILMSNLLFLEISTRMPFLRHSSKCAMTPSTSRKSTDSRASFLMKSSRFMPFADIMATELRRTGSISRSFAISASLA